MDPKRGRPAERGTVEDRRQATVMFADLSGFTATSRLMDPEDLKDAVNECFEAIERVVLHYGGTIDKYIGDAVMARFGAPAALEHAPQNAINAAIAIRSPTSPRSPEPGEAKITSATPATATKPHTRARVGVRSWKATAAIGRTTNGLIAPMNSTLATRVCMTAAKKNPRFAPNSTPTGATRFSIGRN